MAKGKGVGIKGSRRRRVIQRDKDSDESDEEYKVTEDEEEEEEDVAYEDDEEITPWGKKAKQIKKPTEKKKVSFTEVNDEEKVADEDDAELTTFGRKTNQTKKPAKKRRASYKESDDDDDDDDDEYNGDSDDDGDDEEEDDYAESVSPSIKRSRRKKHDEDNDEMEDEDDEESMSLGKKANQIKKPSKKDAVSCTGLDVDDDDDFEEYTEHESSSRKRNQRNKPRENRSIVYTEDEYEDEDEYVDVDDVEDEDDDLDEYVDEDDDGSMYSGRKANRKRKLREKRGVSYTESDDEDGFGFISTRKEANQIKEPREEKTVLYNDDDQEEEDDEKDVEFKLSESDFVDDEDDSISTQKKANQIKEPREENTVSYKDDDQEEEDDETDVEFKLSESDFVDDEYDSPKIQKSEKVNRSHPQKKTVRGRLSKSKKSKSKHSTKSKQKNLRSGRKLGSSKENKNQVEKQSKKRKPRVRADSDSDFVSSASSHHELTLSEDEREQVREAKIFGARDNSRSSSCGNEEEPAREQRKYLLRKGKEKVEDVKDETWKQVCGICLSEEGKRTVRGQRFATITKAAKSDTTFALRTVVIPVPECDQVYQPSEEELRGYLDPYENVMCTECQRGGDDALMLLCDICDSSAHTFCVGLGQEVPEGNWYCDGCRPTVFSSLNSQLTTPTSDRRLSSNVSDLSSPIAGGFDLNEAYVPETPLTQQAHVFPEPRLPVNDFLAGPTGTGATTLRDRRRIRRQIHHRFWNNNRISGTSPSSSGVRLFGSQLEQRVAQPYASFNGRENHNNDFMSSIHDIDFFSSRADQFSVEVQNSNLASLDMSLQGENGASGMAFDSRAGYPQFHPCTNRVNITTDPCREVIGPSRTSQGGFHAPY
nr:sarcoplasmic reticulum histidine-rich calcium-binding protein-like [Tanacetum cinerariifolium]